MKVIFGAVYRRKTNDSHNDQHYYCYIPVAYKTEDGVIKYKMVDTYMIRNTCWADTSYDKKIWFLEQANCGETSSKIYYDHRNYYYQNYYTIDSLELNEDEWELIADLHDYRIISDDETRNYLQEDLVKYLPLWNEDNYRWGSGRVGSCFVKKNAKKDGWKVYLKSSDDNYFGFDTEWRLESLEKTCKEVLANMELARGHKTEIKRTLKKIRKYRELSKEYDKFCKELNSKGRRR